TGAHASPEVCQAMDQLRLVASRRGQRSQAPLGRYRRVELAQRPMRCCLSAQCDAEELEIVERALLECPEPRDGFAIAAKRQKTFGAEVSLEALRGKRRRRDDAEPIRAFLGVEVPNCVVTTAGPNALVCANGLRQLARISELGR